MRHLLTHTGGFEGDLWSPTSDGDDALERFVAEHVSQAEQHVEPGRFFSYCSAGMGVLGRVVEVRRGMTFNEALRHHLADPLGLDEVVVDAGEAPAFRTAIGHVSAGPGGPLHPLRTWAVMPPSNPAAGNQLAMTARGLVAFAAMHLGDGRTPGGVRLLSEQSARLMRQPHVDLRPATGQGASQGLGWRIGHSPHVVDHGGDAPGNACMFTVLPDHGVAIAALANGGDMSPLFATLSEDLLGRLAGVTPGDVPPAPDAAPMGDPGRYCGTYALRNQVTEVTARRLRPTLAHRDRTQRGRHDGRPGGGGSRTPRPGACVAPTATPLHPSTRPAGGQAPSSSSARTTAAGLGTSTWAGRRPGSPDRRGYVGNPTAESGVWFT